MDILGPSASLSSISSTANANEVPSWLREGHNNSSPAKDAANADTNSNRVANRNANSPTPKAGAKEGSGALHAKEDPDVGTSQTVCRRMPAAFGEYTVVKVLGRGSFGEVFEVTKDGKSYAIKSVEAGNKTADTELEFASNVSACVESKFLVRYYETLRGERGELYVVMELCKQGDLRALIDNLAKGGKDAILDQSRVVKIFIQLLLGLSVLHKNKILHRDLKPDNVFVDGEDNVKIGDFGCAKLLKSVTEQAHTCIGTPLYESPEVVKGQAYAFSSDMWSLGVMLYELCTLTRPFTHPNRYVLINVIMSGKYKPISRLRCCEEVRDIVDSLLCMDKNKRPTAAELLERPFIREYADEFDLLQYYPPTMTPRSSSSSSSSAAADSSGETSSLDSLPPLPTLPLLPQ